MKKIYVLGFVLGLFVGMQSLQAQLVATMDDLSLESESYWNGSDNSGYFLSGPVTFLNNYNADYFSWSGFAYSNITDTFTPGYLNQYSCIAAKGAKESLNFAVGCVFGTSRFTLDNTSGIYGLYVNNATYAALSMQNGDDFSKKFGGESGNDPDWFKLIIKGWTNDNVQQGTVEFYLADYRFEDNSKDYIVKDWQWLDLAALHEVDYVTFEMESSDNGDWGMNTPGYFCIDNVTLKDFTQVKFIVSDGDNKLDDVSVAFAGSTLTTDVNGEAIFEQVSPTEQMEYTIYKDGYENYSGVINGFETTEVTITLTVGVNDSKIAENITVFPNPVRQTLNVSMDYPFSLVSIYNLAGQQMMEFQVNDTDELQLDVSSLIPGVYLVSIETPGQIIQKKFIKQ